MESSEKDLRKLIRKTLQEINISENDLLIRAGVDWDEVKPKFLEKVNNLVAKIDDDQYSDAEDLIGSTMTMLKMWKSKINKGKEMVNKSQNAETLDEEENNNDEENGNVDLSNYNGWEKQSEWKGNPSLGLDSYKKVFQNQFNNKKIPVYIFGKEGKGKDTPIWGEDEKGNKIVTDKYDASDWQYVVSAGPYSDYSHSGGFYPETPTLKQAMDIVDERYKNKKLIREMFGGSSKEMDFNILQKLKSNIISLLQSGADKEKLKLKIISFIDNYNPRDPYTKTH